MPTVKLNNKFKNWFQNRFCVQFQFSLLNVMDHETESHSETAGAKRSRFDSDRQEVVEEEEYELQLHHEGTLEDFDCPGSPDAKYCWEEDDEDDENSKLQVKPQKGVKRIPGKMGRCVPKPNEPMNEEARSRLKRPLDGTVMNFERETDPVVLARRSKQIEYGKNTPEYFNYMNAVPKYVVISIVIKMITHYHIYYCAFTFLFHIISETKESSVTQGHLIRIANTVGGPGMALLSNGELIFTVGVISPSRQKNNLLLMNLNWINLMSLLHRKRRDLPPRRRQLLLHFPQNLGF